MDKRIVRKKRNKPAAIASVAAVAAVSGCVPLEPVEPVVQDSSNADPVCRMESPIGSHIKEEICSRPGGQWETTSSGADDTMIDDDSSVVFRTITIERFESRPVALPEAKCGAQNWK